MARNQIFADATSDWMHLPALFPQQQQLKIHHKAVGEAHIAI